MEVIELSIYLSVGIYQSFLNRTCLYLTEC